MESDGSVTRWLHQLQAGNATAAEQLWERYCARLGHLARRHLGAHPRRSLDEEDVIVSVFDALFRGMQEGRFPALHDRDNLWRLLVVITARKAADKAEFEARRHAIHPRATIDSACLSQAMSNEPTPDFVAQMTEECERRLQQLPDESLRQLALWRLEGYSQQEIADRLRISLRSVERKIQRIRSLWGDSVVGEDL